MKASAILLDKGPSSSSKMLVYDFALLPTGASHALVKSENSKTVLMEDGIPYTFG